MTAARNWIAGFREAGKMEGESAALIEQAKDRVKRESVLVGIWSPDLSGALKAKETTIAKAVEATGVAKAFIEAANKVGKVLAVTGEKFDPENEEHVALMAGIWKAVKSYGQAHLSAADVAAIVKAKPATVKDAHDALVGVVKAGKDAAAAKKKAEKEQEEKEGATPETVLGMLGRAVEQVKAKASDFSPEDVAALEGYVNDLILITMTAREAVSAPTPEKVDA
jgi:hypothetical protein